MTDPLYILDFMRDNDMRFFTISNSFDRETVKQFGDNSLDEGIQKLEKLFKHNKGFFRVKLYSVSDTKRDGTPTQKPCIFEGSIVGDEFKKEKPVTGLGNVENVVHHSAPSPTGAHVDLNKYLDKHEVVSELRATIVRLEMELSHTKENHARELEQHKKDSESKLKEATDSNAMFGQGISMLMSRMGVAE